MLNNHNYSKSQKSRFMTDSWVGVKTVLVMPFFNIYSCHGVEKS